MIKSMRRTIPVAVLGIAGLGLAGLSVGMAGAASADTATTYSTTLNPLNGSGASGNYSISLNGNEAKITGSFSGLAAKFMEKDYPHVQHIHGGGMGQCPTPSADKNGDGIVDTVEGQPAYGAIQTTLSTSGDTSPAAGTSLPVAAMGASGQYNRTITLDAATVSSLKSGTAVIVMHGLDPSTLSPTAANAKSNLVPSLPLAATSPALCGVLSASQMSATPVGASPTGGGSTSGVEDAALLALGGALALGGGAAFVARRRMVSAN